MRADVGAGPDTDLRPDHRVRLDADAVIELRAARHRGAGMDADARGRRRREVHLGDQRRPERREAPEAPGGAVRDGLHLEVQHLARQDGTPEPGPLDADEAQRGVVRHHGGELRQRLTEHHPREHGAPGKCPTKYGSFALTSFSPTARRRGSTSSTRSTSAHGNAEGVGGGRVVAVTRSYSPPADFELEVCLGLAL
jgi:hypothetical protein